MTDDLVTRLRSPTGYGQYTTCQEAADRIEALEKWQKERSESIIQQMETIIKLEQDVELHKRLSLSQSNRISELTTALREIAASRMQGPPWVLIDIARHVLEDKS